MEAKSPSTTVIAPLSEMFFITKIAPPMIIAMIPRTITISSKVKPARLMAEILEKLENGLSMCIIFMIQ